MPDQIALLGGILVHVVQLISAPLWIDADDNPDDGAWQRQWLWSKAASIAGGTSEVQRTIIGDRILGLPR